MYGRFKGLEQLQHREDATHQVDRLLLLFHNLELQLGTIRLFRILQKGNCR